GGEAEADRLQDGVDAERHPPSVQGLDDAVESLQRRRHVGHGDDFAAPGPGGVEVARVDTQHQFGPGPDGGFDLGGVETVDRDAQAFVPQGPHGVGGVGPGDARVTAQVDDVGAGVPVGAGPFENLRPTQARDVVDLRENLNVERAGACYNGRP